MSSEDQSAHRGRVSGYTAALLATSFWAFGHVSTKYSVLEIAPMALVFLRLVASSAIFAAFIAFRSAGVLTLARRWPSLLPLGIAVVGSQVFWIAGLEHTTPAHTALIFTLLPVFTAVLTALLTGERLSQPQAGGIAIAFAGAALLATGGRLSLEGRYLFGDAVVMGAVVSFSYYTVRSRSLAIRYGSRRVLALSYLLAAPLVAPLLLVQATQMPWGEVSALGWASVVYLVLFATIAPLQLHTYALKHLPSTTVASFVYVQPVIASVFSVLLVGERLAPEFYASAALIFVGLMFYLGAERRALRLQKETAFTPDVQETIDPEPASGRNYR